MSEKRKSILLGKVTVLIVVCCLLMGRFFINTALALEGSGTQEDPWLIQSLEDFNDFAADPNYWDDYTRLQTDVNLAGLTYTTAVIAPDTNSSASRFQGTAFTGVFAHYSGRLVKLFVARVLWSQHQYLKVPVRRALSNTSMSV